MGNTFQAVLLVLTGIFAYAVLQHGAYAIRKPVDQRHALFACVQRPCIRASQHVSFKRSIDSFQKLSRASEPIGPRGNIGAQVMAGR